MYQNYLETTNLKGFKEIKEQLNSQLTSSLADLENMRLHYSASIKKAWVATVVCFTISGLIAAMMQSIIPIIVAAVISILIFIFSIGNKRKDLVKSWKNTILSSLAKTIDKSLTYRADGLISQSEYKASRIFLTKHDRYNGEDLFQGTYGKTKLKFSELKTEYKTTSSNSKGHRTTHWHNIFKGVFMIVDFNKDFQTDMLVLPDMAQKMFGFLGQTLQSINFNRDSLVKLENSEFEKEFVVYANDQVEARYILTPALMEKIVILKRDLRSEIYLSFINSKLYIAFTTNSNFFEPDLNISFTNQAELEKHYYDLIDIIQIIDDLDLNTRIWSKQ